MTSHTARLQASPSPSPLSAEACHDSDLAMATICQQYLSPMPVTVLMAVALAVTGYRMMLNLAVEPMECAGTAIE